MRTDDPAFENSVHRAFESLQDDFRSMVVNAAERIAPACESPIELMLGTTMLCGGMILDATKNLDKKFISFEGPADRDASIMHIHPQYEWGGYRIDFAITVFDREAFMVFVECDGHDFHERNADQAERDRSKDRKIQEAGIPILRFTGREIYRSPARCVTTIMDFIFKRMKF